MVSGLRTPLELVSVLIERTEEVLPQSVPEDMQTVIEETNRTVAGVLRLSLVDLSTDAQEYFAYLGGGYSSDEHVFPLRLALRLAKRLEFRSQSPEDTFDELVQAGLIEPRGNQRFQIHALLGLLAKTIYDEHHAEERPS